MIINKIDQGCAVIINDELMQLSKSAIALYVWICWLSRNMTEIELTNIPNFDAVELTTAVSELVECNLVAVKVQKLKLRGLKQARDVSGSSAVRAVDLNDPNSVAGQHAHVEVDKNLLNYYNINNIIYYICIIYIMYILNINNSVHNVHIEKKVYTKVYTKEKADEVKSKKFIEALDRTLNENIELKNSILRFIRHRGEIKKKLTDGAIKLMCNRIKKLADDDIIALLDRAVENGWTGVYMMEKKAVSVAPVSVEISTYSSKAELRNKVERLQKDGYVVMYFLNDVRVDDTHYMRVIEDYFESLNKKRLTLYKNLFSDSKG